jgi:hypothetical protein
VLETQEESFYRAGKRGSIEIASFVYGIDIISEGEIYLFEEGVRG